MGSIPRQGTKIPHVPGQLSPVPQLERPVHHSKDPAQPKLKKKRSLQIWGWGWKRIFLVDKTIYTQRELYGSNSVQERQTGPNDPDCGGYGQGWGPTPRSQCLNNPGETASCFIQRHPRAFPWQQPHLPVGIETGGGNLEGHFIFCSFVQLFRDVTSFSHQQVGFHNLLPQPHQAVTQCGFSLK